MLGEDMPMRKTTPGPGSHMMRRPHYHGVIAQCQCLI